MQKWLKILGIVLVVQLVLFALVQLRQEPTAVTTGNVAMLTVNFDEVDKFTLEDSNKKPLELVKTDGVWHLPSYFNAAASSEKLAAMTTAFKEFKKGWPAGKTMVSAKQFEVTDEKFERRVVFSKGETKLATLYFGSSPSFRKAHVRLDGEDLTYTASYNTVDLPVSAHDWVDKNLNKLDRTKVTSLALNGLTFKAVGPDFHLDGLTSSEMTNQERLSPVVEKLLNPSFDEILGQNETPSTPKVFSYKLTLSDGKDVEVNYFEAAKTVDAAEKKDDKTTSDSVVFKTTLQPYTFKVKRSRIEDMMKANRETFVKAATAPTEVAPAEGAAVEGAGTTGVAPGSEVGKDSQGSAAQTHDAAAATSAKEG